MSFYDGYVSQVKNKIIGGVALEYFTKYSHFNSFVFVEGLTDVIFYNLIVKEKIGNNVSFIKCGGKENVIYFSNFLIRNNIEQRKDNHYIVDKDYTSLNKLKSLCAEKVSVTKHYGVENYAFEDENLDLILRNLNLLNEDVINVKESLKKFVKLIVDFETIISLSTNNEMHDIKLKAKELDENIIFVDENTIFLKKEMQQRITSIISSFTKKQKKLFNRRREELFNNYLDLRGHDLELFFNKILTFYNKEEKLSVLLSNTEIISRLKIDFELKW